jgi:hypothetical protein
MHGDLGDSDLVFLDQGGQQQGVAALARRLPAPDIDSSEKSVGEFRLGEFSK